jgi:hypothetical protein
VHELLAAVTEAVPNLTENQGRAYKQNTAGHVNSYFTRLLPPHGWRFIGAKVALTTDRADLLWEHPTGRVLADELYTGRGELIASTPIQIRGQDALHRAAAVFGPRLAGLRLLATGKPHLSQLHARGTLPVPLQTTPFVHDRRTK